MAWEDWENKEKADVWNKILDSLEDEAVRFSLDQKPNARITVTRSRWDSPDVELRWGSEEVQRNIHIVVKGSDWPVTLEFSGAAWQDLDRPGGRKRQGKAVTVFSRPSHSLDELSQHIRNDLEKAFRAISALSTSAGRVTSAD